MEELILKEREVKEQFIKILNESKLPAFILKYILKDLFEQIDNLAQQQYMQAEKIKAEKEEKEAEKDGDI